MPRTSSSRWAAERATLAGLVAASTETQAVGTTASTTPRGKGRTGSLVPAETMGPGVRQFAEYQPFTPIIETLRGLLTGEPSASSAIVAVVWCVGIALVGYVWSLSTFKKRA